MRKRGEYIRTTRVVLSKKQAQLLFFRARTDLNLSWRALAERFGVSVCTVRSWASARTTTPEYVYDDLIGVNQSTMAVQVLGACWGQRKGGRVMAQRRTVSFPDLHDPRFAELYGALLGDGCIEKHTGSLVITGNARSDVWYMEGYLKLLLTELFSLPVHVYRSKNTLRLKLTHKKIQSYFADTGYFAGKKQVDVPVIPRILFRPQLARLVIRGLFDTDGGVYPHPHSRMMIDITCKIPALRKQLIELLHVLDYSSGTTHTGIQLYGRKAEAFIRDIGSSNPRNIHRYLCYRQDGPVPSAKEMERYLIDNACHFYPGP